MDNQRLPLFERELQLRQKHDVDVVLIRCGYFYEAYGKSADRSAEITGYRVGVITRGTVTTSISGCPKPMIKDYLSRLENGGLKVALVEQTDPLNPRQRELLYVTGDDHDRVGGGDIELAVPQRELISKLEVELKKIHRTKDDYATNPRKYTVPKGYGNWASKVIKLHRELDKLAGLPERDDNEIMDLYRLNLASWYASGVVEFEDPEAKQRRRNLDDWRWR